MALPPALETVTETVTITGLGGAPRGEFLVAGERGSFTRSASRLSLFDALHEGESAVAGFALGPSGEVTGRCRIRRRTSSIGVLTYEFRPMVDSCSFAGAGQPQLTLAEARSTSRPEPMKRERAGEMTFGGVRLVLRSSHELAGSPMWIASPIGCVFERDRRAAAAVEVNGTEPAIVLRAGSDGAERQAATLASLALALLWDLG